MVRKEKGGQSGSVIRFPKFFCTSSSIFMSGLKLYTSPQCPFGRRAMITMLEKGLVCEYVWIPLSGQLKKMAEDPSGFKATIDKQWPGKSLKVHCCRH